MFPEGMGYDKSNDKVRTPRVNLLFSTISMITRVMKDYKKGEPVDFNKFSALVTQDTDTSNLVLDIEQVILFDM